MATLCDSRSVGNLRVYSPDIDEVGAPLWEDQLKEKSLLRGMIRRHYEAALDRLAVRWHPGMLPRFLDAGLCVGLLDPASNIIANALLAGGQPEDDEPPAGGVAVVDGATLTDMARRSRDGLVAFLTSFFPYLDGWEAVHYLLLADADPLAAARVVEDRGLRTFRFASAATDRALTLALRCAAIAARHPRAAELADKWVPLSRRLDEAVAVLSAVQRHFPRDILCTFGRLVQSDSTSSAPAPPPLPLSRAWELAAARSKVAEVPYQHSRSLRRVLLDRIHGFYLTALARLPTDTLQSRYHRSLLKAGHCYGPFDPVSNIILNTIWYDAAFPPPVPTPELDMLASMTLMRTEGWSFYGLVSFLCTRDHNLSLHQALQFLLDTNLSSLRVDPSHEAAGTEQEAFMAAAAAARHPKRDAQVEFLSSCKAMLSPADLALLQGGGRLSSQDVSRLARVLCPSVGTAIRQQPAGKLPLRYIDEGNSQRSALRRTSKKIKAALRRYEEQNNKGSPCYQLHVICGVNEYVSGPEHCEGPSSKKKWCCCYLSNDVYHRSHANFLVTQNVGNTASDPILFFAEFSNGDDDDQDDELLCCPVTFPPPFTEPVRCLYCEHEGVRIVHPTSENFHGRELEFEKMVLEEAQYLEYEKMAGIENRSDEEELDPSDEEVLVPSDEELDPSDDDEFHPAVEYPFYTNERILSSPELTKTHEEDYIYVDSDYFTENEDESFYSD